MSEHPNLERERVTWEQVLAGLAFLGLTGTTVFEWIARYAGLQLAPDAFHVLGMAGGVVAVCCGLLLMNNWVSEN